jgi:hypothetical protein
MYGVILWSDPYVRKAVIWCEEKGSLAYYEAPEHVERADDLFFDTGDYVEFDVTMDNDLARAQNAQVVMSAGGPSIPHTLSIGTYSDPVIRKPLSDGEARVIQLADHRATPQPRQLEFNRRG